MRIFWREGVVKRRPPFFVIPNRREKTLRSGVIADNSITAGPPRLFPFQKIFFEFKYCPDITEGYVA